MLTIKHVEANGDEFLMEAVSFVAERVPGCLDRRFMTFDTPYRENGNQTGLWYGGPEQGPNCAPSVDDTLYVMNRFGATVATHRFVPSSATHGQLVAAA